MSTAYSLVMGAWLIENAARIKEVSQAIDTSRVIIKANQTQLAYLRKMRKEGQILLAKHLYLQGRAKR
jgi:nanoRNase/pAp phosphatase (c-di-AMP/oligoRNAs hydrolase)